MELKASEIILREARANHLRHSQGIGGRLFLTNQRLLFKPHLFNAQTVEATIPLESIVGIATPHSDFLSAKLALILKNDFIKFFVVRTRKGWMKEIEAAVAEIKKSRGENWHNNQEISEEIVFASRAILRKIIIGGIVTGIVTCVLMLLYYCSQHTW